MCANQDQLGARRGNQSLESVIGKLVPLQLNLNWLPQVSVTVQIDIIQTQHQHIVNNQNAMSESIRTCRCCSCSDLSQHKSVWSLDAESGARP